MSKPFIAIGPWRLHAEEGLLVRGDTEKRLQPKVMEVLQCLLEQPGELVSRDDLLLAVWGERAVSDEPLTRCIAELRSAFEDRAGEPQFIETLPKRGYRLIAPVQTGPSSPPALTGPRPLLWGLLGLSVLALVVFGWLATHTDEATRAAVPGEPFLAVLPFVNISGDESQTLLAEGISETLTQVLSRDRRLKVVARTSAFTFKGRTVDVREIGQTLGVDSLLEGRVQREGDTLRITVQLVETARGLTLWSETYDRPVGSLFDLQDEIAAEVASALELTLFDDDASKGSYYGARDFDAYLEYVRGLDAFRSRTTESMAFAIDRFRKVTEMDPRFALAWVGLAEALVVNQWYADVPLDESLAQADEAIERALALDPELGEAWSVIGLMEFKRARYSQSEQALSKAVTLVPNNARAWFYYGTLLNDTGRPGEALEKHRASARLDPLAPVVLTAIGVSLEKLGRFQEAMDQYQKVTRVVPGYPSSYDRIGILAWNVFGQAETALSAHRKALSIDADNTWTRPLVAEMALGLDDPGMARAWIDASMEAGSSKMLPNLALALLMAYEDEDPVRRMAHARRWLDDAFTYADLDALLRLYRDAAIEAGQPDAAVALYRETMPELFREAEAIDVARFGPAIDLAYLLKLRGEAQEADRLLRGAWAVIESLPRNGCCGYGVADVEVLAISGRADEAVARMGQAFDAGFRSIWWWHIRSNPNLSSLQDRRDFQEQLKRFAHRAERERQALQIPVFP